MNTISKDLSMFTQWSLFLIILIFASCSQVTQRKPVDESNLSEAFRAKIEETRNLIRLNNGKLAMTKLAELKDENLSELEKSIKYNLKGVALFSISEFDKALLNFEVSEKYTPKDSQLFSQVKLNIASCYFKLNRTNELHSKLEKIDIKDLNENEKKKYAQLLLSYGKKVDDAEAITVASVLVMGDLKTFKDIQQSSYYADLTANFKRLTQGQKIAILEKYQDEKNMPLAQLAQIEAEERYLQGDKSGTQDVLDWLKSEYNNDEISKYVDEFEKRLESSTRISVESIGVVLPLTGPKQSFGQKALLGVEAGLKILGIPENVKLYTKDSMDSGAQGAQSVADLIQQQKVSFIIGGLFPEAAKAEYLEAKRYGVLFISLSTIDLPREEKNHHLIEVQGSIQSQVSSLLSQEMINKFGRRLGVIYPDNESGQVYLNEVWRQAQAKNVSLKTIAAYPKNSHDFRETAQHFLGLRYPREREEELKILSDVYAHEKGSARRVQTLPPELDFDWVFLASFPYEAIQIIPTLGYYDANRVKVVGGPTWATRSMIKEQKNIGTMYFVGEDPKDLNQEMLGKFQELYKQPAGLIEVMGMDSMKIGAQLLSFKNISSREDFDKQLRELEAVKGLSSQWELQDGLWLKRMNAMTITRGDFVKLFEAETLKN